VTEQPDWAMPETMVFMPHRGKENEFGIAGAWAATKAVVARRVRSVEVFIVSVVCELKMCGVVWR